MDLKKIRNITQNGLWGINNQAMPGEILEHRITYVNHGSSPIKALSVSDATPNYTICVSASVDTTPTVLTACQKNTPANPAPLNAAVACPEV